MFKLASGLKLAPTICPVTHRSGFKPKNDCRVENGLKPATHPAPDRSYDSPALPLVSFSRPPCLGMGGVSGYSRKRPPGERMG